MQGTRLGINIQADEKSFNEIKVKQCSKWKIQKRAVLDKYLIHRERKGRKKVWDCSLGEKRGFFFSE